MKTDGTMDNHPAISREHLEEHYKLYPAVHKTKIKEIEARLIRVDKACVDPTYCPLRSLKKEYAYALNSVRLHDLYFENTGEAGSKPSPELVSAMEQYFGSLQEWEEQFSALALCSRGWVILGLDLTDGSLKNFFADDHSEGVWSVIPLLVLDVYEHAYCQVFKTRSDYIKSFFKGIKWKTVNRRLNAAKKIFKKVEPVSG
ncbi:MAG: Superoxide dismutase (Fe) [Firmicutes bacterium ADurb.Bin456]|nr:MAG: Superoxide dismutase (Fe) [Firmicutes bacterium ADurb.Bin456]